MTQQQLEALNDAQDREDAADSQLNWDDEGDPDLELLFARVQAARQIN